MIIDRVRDVNELKKLYESRPMPSQYGFDWLVNNPNQINNYIRRIAPEYQAPNDRFSLIKNVEQGLDSENTIAKKIAGIGSRENVLSGLDQRLKDVDTLLPNQNKFYKQALDTIQSENEVNQIRNMIGRQYERNPRLLANRTDEAFEQALEDLQKRTNINFMDELRRTRAREAFEQFTPGQGGGSGSGQGYANFMRTAFYNNLPDLFGPIKPFIGATLFSPKFHGQNIVKNYAKTRKATEKLSNLYDLIIGNRANAEINALNSLLEE